MHIGASVPRRETPLVFLQHFRGDLDNWNPLVTSCSRTQRETCFHKLLLTVMMRRLAWSGPSLVSLAGRQAACACDQDIPDLHPSATTLENSHGPN